MRRVLIGHRGVGKSSLLKRHLNYFPEFTHFDLDVEIERTNKRAIVDIFLNEGEKYFRQLEVDQFNTLIQNYPYFVISVGGGFNPQNIPTDIEVIYVSRETDADGRIFLNRPMIHSGLSFLEDSQKLYSERHQNFLKRADFIYHMPEGIAEQNEIEKKILSLNLKTDSSVSAYFTPLMSNEMNLNINSLELRTDFFSNIEIENFIQKNPEKNYIISYRTLTEHFFCKDNVQIEFDWALELGQIPETLKSIITIVSVHDTDLHASINLLEKYLGYHLKLCPIIQNWDELILGFQWQQKDPIHRSFLPRSIENSGDWNWFRILMLSKQKINFVRGQNQLLDQPTWYQFLNSQVKNNKKWLAVLGDPIKHSWSPITHQDFFQELFLKVKIQIDEFNKALIFLESLGLFLAAVTSPLKKIAGETANRQSECNSLKFKNGKWLGCSTDHKGFEKLISQIPSSLLSRAVLWGGDGVISSLHQIKPDLVCYSAQTGEIKQNPHKLEFEPLVVIWGAPRRQGVIFPQSWKPEFVVDLNYTTNSMGLEYASLIQCKYISGADMFYEQAFYQRQFWKDET